MALKITRQPKKIVVIGAPSSAGAHSAGVERAPAALRAAGLVSRLAALGYEVTDAGDCPVQMYRPDEESPRARNLGSVLAALNALRPHVEHAVKFGALPLVLGGDCTIALATLAGVRRYYPHVSLMWFDGDADLNTPATTPSGCLHGMVVAHIIGRGAPELVRFSSEPPLVREPDVALFGLDRLDPPEEELLRASPMRRYAAVDIRRQGAAAAAQAAIDRIHAANKQLVLHFDVDVICAEDFPASDFGSSGGLRLAEVREALEILVKQPNLAAVEIAAYNPERDPQNSCAQVLVDLLAAALAARFAALGEPAGEPQKAVSVSTEPVAAAEPAAAPAAEPTAEPAAEPAAEPTAEPDKTAEATTTEPPADSPTG